MSIPLRTLLDFALDAAWQAGRITLGYFQTGVSAERKSDNSPVTIADKQSEKKLREMIGHYWPDHQIIGEEFGRSAEAQKADAYTWILDPIDGTKSFVQGVPLYGVLIGLMHGEESLIGVAHFPALNETVYAAKGEGCYWNGRRAHVSKTSQLKDAVLLGSDVRIQNASKRTGWQRLVEATYVQRTWGDSYGYLLVATGRADIMMDEKMAIWDCAPFPVILNEAGGTFTDWRGTPGISAGESIATNGALFDQVMVLVK